MSVARSEAQAHCLHYGRIAPRSLLQFQLGIRDESGSLQIMKVVFVHPSHPNQFTRIAQGLAKMAGWDCACLVRATSSPIRCGATNRPWPITAIARAPTALSGNYISQCLEEGIRCGQAAAEALAYMKNSGRHRRRGRPRVLRQHIFCPPTLGRAGGRLRRAAGLLSGFRARRLPAEAPQTMMDASLRALIHASVLDADLCVAPLRHAKRLFPRELQPRVRVQAEGFALPPLPNDKRALRRALGMDETAPLIGFAGRTLEAVRGFDIFYRAASAIHRARPDARFLVIGDEATIYGNELSYLDGKSFKQHVLAAGALPDQAFHFKPFLAHESFIKHVQALDVILFPLF